MRFRGPDLSLDGLVFIDDYPKQAERRFPGRPAIVGDELTLSYRQLDEASDRFAAWLRASGVPAGSRVAYVGKNSPLLFPVFFGCIRAGCVLVPVNWRFAVPEMRYVIDDSESRVVVAGAEVHDAVAEACRGLAPAPVLLSTVAAAPDGLQALLFDGPLPHAGDAGHAGHPGDPASIDPDAVCLQLYTSGTTGRPKGVLETRRKLSVARWMEVGSPDWADWHAGDVLLSAMPNFHSGGLSYMLIGLLRSITCVLTADPSPANLLKLSRQHAATRTFVVPAVIRALVEMVEAGSEPAPPLKSIFYGAAPMDVELIQRCQRLFPGCGFGQYYGMTEAAGSATFFPPKEHRIDRPERLRSVGRLLPAFEMEIRDAQGRVLGIGEAGEIYLRSPTIMLGYWKRPEATAEVLDADGWYRSGDGGRVDADGWLFLTDRVSDLIISGGENIFPIEVEQVLRLHPAVQDVVVVGARDARWGETVCAVVELRAGQSVGLQELQDFARPHIAGFKLPRVLRIVEQLPRTATGKLQRGEVWQRLGAAGGAGGAGAAAAARPAN
ncbi:MAG: AMP-binding protein [Proteobacteria bacterium]|nr:AMP-binding protein [Pseudomonadota bacterium]